MVALWSTYLFGQGPDTLWTKTYGGTGYELAWGAVLQQTLDHGYIIAGYTSSFGAGGADFYLIKTDSNGDTSWTRTYGGAYDEGANSVQQTFDGGYIIAGPIFSYDSAHVWLIKTDSNGDTLWTRKYPGAVEYDWYYIARQTSDSGYIIAGQTGVSMNYDVYLIKTDKIGDTLWTRKYGRGQWDGAYSVHQTEDEGYIIGGYSDPGVYLIKTDKNGDSLWTKVHYETWWDKCFSLYPSSDGGYIITGESGFDWYHSDVLLMKTESDGELIWRKTYGGIYEECSFSVQETFDGGSIVAGRTVSFGAGDWDAYLIKADRNGNTEWTQTFGGNDLDAGYCLQQTSDGGYIICGETQSFGAGYSDIYLIKTKPLNLTSPIGGEILSGDSIHTITWWCEYPRSNQYDFLVLFSEDGGSSYPDTIAKAVNSDSTSWDWTVPNINSATCRVKLEILDSLSSVVFEDASDSNFTIASTAAPVAEGNERNPAIGRIRIFPNPFLNTVQIEGCSEISIYDISGRFIAEAKGQWDGRDFRGDKANTGIYILRSNGETVGKVIKLE
jgi:hypothetical protein